MRRFHPEVQPITLLYTIFIRKGTPSVYPPFKDGIPFTFLVRNIAFSQCLEVISNSSGEHQALPEQMLTKTKKT